MNKRVFLLIGNTLNLYEWENKTLIGNHSFEFNESGFSFFKKTIEALPVCPAQLLVSMPNEDFYREKVPHVRKNERSVLVKRFIKKHFRDEKYTNVIFQERDKEGRKDDNVLISSIGSSEEFDQWLALIHELDIPLVGIWSVPLFFDVLLKEKLEEHQNIIFVNRESSGNYRQSLFVNGSLILSRLTDNIHSLNSIHEKIGALNEFVEQLYKFSTNKRILKFDSTVKVLCAFDEVPIPDLIASCSLNNLQYERFDFESSLENELSALCLGHIKQTPHYHHEEDRLTFSIFRKNRKLYQFLAFFSFLMFSSSGAIAIKSLDVYRHADFNYFSAIGLEGKYRDRYSDIDQYLNYAIESESLVNEINKQQLDANQMPIDIFPGLSSVLSMPKFSDIVTNHILWKRYSGIELDSIEQLFVKVEADDAIFDPEEIFEEESQQEKIYIHISGDYFVEHISYDKAIDTMNNLQFELEQLEKINAVHMLRIPVDLRVDSSFKDYKGVLSSKKTRENDRSTFDIVLEYGHE